MQKNWITHTLLVRLYNDKATLEKNLTVSYKTKHETPIEPSSCTVGHFSQRNENLCPYKKPCTQMFTEDLFVIAKMER